MGHLFVTGGLFWFRCSVMKGHSVWLVSGGYLLTTNYYFFSKKVQITRIGCDSESDCTHARI